MSDIFGAEDHPLLREAQRQAQRARQERQQALLAALGHPAGRAWLDAALAEEYRRPSYMVGDSFDAVAYRQGRIAVLREMAEDLHRANQPTGPDA